MERRTRPWCRSIRLRRMTELKLSDLWREVKSEDDWWGDLDAEALRVVKRLLEVCMEEELMEQLRAGRYRRTEFRRGYRNGYRHRNILTKLGLVERLRVPRDREGHYQLTVIEAYQRRPETVNQLIRECFLGGLSTRRVGEVLAPMLGQALSPQTISRVARSLDEEVARFHRRPLVDVYCYLILDGVTMKVKGASGVKKRVVLSAYGVTPQGQRQMIDFRLANAESEAQWEAFLCHLYNRGLEGSALKLVVTRLRRAQGCTGPWTPSIPMCLGRGVGFIS